MDGTDKKGKLCGGNKWGQWLTKYQFMGISLPLQV